MSLISLGKLLKCYARSASSARTRHEH